MKIINLLIDSATYWIRLDMKSYAAAFSYYAPLAIIPILLFSITMVGLIYGESVTRQILTSWGGVLGEDIVRLIKTGIENLRAETQSFSVPIIGILFFLGVSVLALNVLGNGFQRLWQIQVFGFVNWLKKSLRSFYFILIFQLYLAVVIGFEFLMVSINLKSGYIFSNLFLFLSTTAFFTILLKSLVKNSPSWKGCLVGASISAVIFMITKSFVSVFVSNITTLNIYGTAGLVLALLLWVYILASLIYYGATVAYKYDKINHNF